MRGILETSLDHFIEEGFFVETLKPIKATGLEIFCDTCNIFGV